MGDDEIAALNDLVNEIMKGSTPNMLNLSADEVLALYTLAHHLYKNGKFTDSKQIFRFLTICEPFERRYWMGLGASFQMIKDYAAALECYSVAAVQDPNDPFVHLHAADCLFGLGLTKKAVLTLKSAIAAAKAVGDDQLIMQLETMCLTWNEPLENIMVGR